MSIEGIALEYFSALTKDDINSTTPSRQNHTVFNYFLSDNSDNILPLLLHKASVFNTA